MREESISDEAVLDPGRFTKVSVETQAGELEARLSEYGNWEVRIRRHDETTWKHACRGDLNSGSQTMLPVAPKTVETMIRGPIVVDAAARRVTVEDQEVSLAKKEFALLIALAQNPERVWTKGQLLKSVWGHDSDTKTRTLDSHASRLRQKFQRAGIHGIVINVWGVGYKFWDRLDPDWSPPEPIID
ncbi:MAG: winged helix-turn-helix transcriptional regulator [Actinobacteria bacterium]|nr:winged helix-turn-helix transcriptional regulator [Actinomycetota bacterium]